MTLNRFIGALHAARCTAVLWSQHVENPMYEIAAKYGLQMTFGTTMLTLRKFQDLGAGGHLRALVSAEAPARASIEWVLQECEKHNTRKAANRLFAHYAADKADPPLSAREIRDLVIAGGWTTEEEVVAWAGPIIDRLRTIRDDVMSRYGITTFDDDEEAA
jgi:hypothetical protein